MSLIHTGGARSEAPSSTRDECIAKLKAARARMKRPVIPAPSAPAILSLRDGAPGPSVSQLIAIVAKAHGIRPERLKAHCRERPVTRARKHLVHLLFRERPLLSSVQIGRLIGGFDHSSILYSRNTFAVVAPQMQAEIGKAEEALEAHGRAKPFAEAAE